MIDGAHCAHIALCGLLIVAGGPGCGGEDSGAKSKPARADAASDGAVETTDGSSPLDAGDGARGDATGQVDVSGTVVALTTQRPLGNRTVVVGTQRIETDENGRFVLQGVSVPYEAAVVEPDGSVISIYRGLSRSDPVLVHKAAQLDATLQSARIAGKLAGGTAFPLSRSSDVAAVYFFSSPANTRVVFGAGAAPFGPDYLLYVPWSGAPSISGELIAVGTFGAGASDAGAAPYSAWLAKAAVSLQNGQVVHQDLTLAAVSLGSLEGSVTLPASAPLTQFSVYYRLALPDAIVSLPNVDIVRKNPLQSGGAFEYELPDLASAGAELCAAARSQGETELETERCDLALGGAPISIEFGAAPKFSAPASGAQLTRGSPFSWQGGGQGIYLLELIANEPSPAAPAVDVYTAAPSATLPDTRAYGIELPSGAAYRAIVAGLEPYASMDEAMGSTGLGALVPKNRRVSYSAPIGVTTP